MNQEDDDLKATSIVSLPLNLAECNAMISLIEDNYYERSCCSIEVMIMQTLRKSYKFHMWFVDTMDEVSGRHFFAERSRGLGDQHGGEEGHV